MPRQGLRVSGSGLCAQRRLPRGTLNLLDWNGIRQFMIIVTGNDAMNGAAMPGTADVRWAQASLMYAYRAPKPYGSWATPRGLGGRHHPSAHPVRRWMGSAARRTVRSSSSGGTMTLRTPKPARRHDGSGYASLGDFVAAVIPPFCDKAVCRSL